MKDKLMNLPSFPFSLPENLFTFSLQQSCCWVISHHTNADLSSELFLSLKRMKDYCMVLAIVRRELKQPTSLVWGMKIIYSRLWCLPRLLNSEQCSKNGWSSNFAIILMTDKTELLGLRVQTKSQTHYVHATWCPITNTWHANEAIAILMLSEAELYSKAPH